MKISSFNINGVRAAVRKGFLDWIDTSKPDIVCIQELRANEDQIPAELLELEYHKTFHSAEKKGYSGVAILSRKKPNDVIIGSGIDWIDKEGRILTYKYDEFDVISAYFPSGTTGDIRQEIKMNFLLEFEGIAKSILEKGKPTIICGDFNIAHTEIDIHNPKQQQKTSGFLPEERAWVTEFLKYGYQDVFRNLNKDIPDLYSWWSYRAASKSRNKGWRIDYQMVTPNLADKAKAAYIEREWDISDHAPVTIEYDI